MILFERLLFFMSPSCFQNKISFLKQQARGKNVAQLVKCWPSMLKVVISLPHPT